jgi:hypothetical protein
MKLRPVDILRKLLLQLPSGVLESDELKEFIKKYGEAEVCAMCLILACSDLTLMPKEKRSLLDIPYEGKSKDKR